ncbi:hypothetical protein N9850_12895 [Granulosicoccus sp.]|nr:hypothetical protein [Granulosicoccus sp.]MDB4224663.1 hypothetical protein [Granulosicoccus sp.]
MDHNTNLLAALTFLEKTQIDIGLRISLEVNLQAKTGFTLFEPAVMVGTR